jgi:hypothetical protein
MNKIFLIAATLFFLNFVYSAVTETRNCYVLDKKEITDLFQLWNNALKTKDSVQVTKRYTDSAVLLATVSDEPRNTTALIKDYFDDFLLKEPQGVILYSDPEPGCNQAHDMGVYEFTFGKDGSKVKARYSYGYQYFPATNEWKITHHHSSVMPEQHLAENYLKSGLIWLTCLLAFLFI